MVRCRTGLKENNRSYKAPKVYLINKYWLFNDAVIIANKGV